MKKIQRRAKARRQPPVVVTHPPIVHKTRQFLDALTLLCVIDAAQRRGSTLTTTIGHA